MVIDTALRQLVTRPGALPQIHPCRSRYESHFVPTPVLSCGVWQDAAPTSKATGKLYPQSVVPCDLMSHAFQHALHIHYEALTINLFHVTEGSLMIFKNRVRRAKSADVAPSCSRCDPRSHNQTANFLLETVCFLSISDLHLCAQSKTRPIH